MAIPDWSVFTDLRDRLITSNAFRLIPGVMHRLRHIVGDLPVDLVPFGAIENNDRIIRWPLPSDHVMNVFGFREALGAAEDLSLPGDVQSKIVSLPALALLKLICWKDRHDRSPGKDAVDLYVILRHYFDAGNENRFWHEFSHWTQEPEFSLDLVGAKMVGHDVRALIDEAGFDRVSRLLADQADEQVPGRLPAEMNRSNPDRPRTMLTAMLEGLIEA